MERILLSLLIGTLFMGCQTARPLYYWGNYEALIYQSYTAPEKAPPEVQLEKLREDLEKAKAANLPPPPGLHAHLGFLYYTLGKYDEAQTEFETEKHLFPESAVFIERMLQQHQTSAKS